MPVCNRCGADNPDGFRFCGACGSPLDVDEVAPREERKVVTVIFTDIVGSTARAEKLDPEDVRAVLAPYYVRLRQELERFGGTVEKFIGDAVVAVFGAPIAHEDDPERAVRSALAIRSAVAEMNAADATLDLHIRIGVNTGEALVVLDARPSEGEGMVAGDVINTAARLQSLASIDGIFVGDLTRRATSHTIDYRSVAPLQAKGKSEPLVAWETLGPKKTPSTSLSARHRLIGRSNELSRLGRALARVTKNRAPGVVTILGSAGVGKSRLLDEFAAQLGGAAVVYRGRCLSYGEGITYWPIVDIFKGAAGILQSDETDVVSAKLEALLATLHDVDEDELRTMAAALGNLLGVTTTLRGAFDTGQITQAELHWGIRRVLQVLSERAPIAVFFEDVHWAEPTLIDLIRFLCEPTVGFPVLVVASARPEFIDQQPAFVDADRNREIIELAALSEDESRALLGELFGLSALPHNAVDSLLRIAGGNPLFLEETVGMLQAAGSEAPAGDSTATLDEIGIPTSLHSLIEARLDQLPAPQKVIAQRAAVAGSVFWVGAIEHLDGISGNVSDSLNRLERRDFVHERTTSSVAGEQEYAFKHALIRDVAYGQIPKGQRTKLHARFADWVSGLPGWEEEFIEIIAYHLEQSCLLAMQITRSPEPPPVVEAVKGLVRAAEKAERHEGLQEADRFYERALEIIGDDHPDTVVDVRLRRAKIMSARGQLRRATAELVEIAEESLAVGRPDLRCDALIALANVDQKQGRPADARRRLTEAEGLSFEIGDQRLRIRSGYEYAELRADFDGEDEAAVDDLRHSLEIATELDDRALRIEGHLRMGMLLLNAGKPASAQDELLRCSLLAAEMGGRRDEARATYALGVAKYYLGELHDAKSLALRARDWLQRTDDSYFQIQNLLALALNALAGGEPRQAEQWLSEALPLALEGGGWLVVEIYRYMVEALVLQGRLEDAAELAVYARKGAPEEDLHALAAVAVADALVATARENKTVALQCFAEAIGMLAAQESPIPLAETRVSYARALRRFGDEEASRAELKRARATFAGMGARALVAEIDRELNPDH
jgi:class 3 adenylate cyclase/tetratricopeptide (TPR) repeat protein